MSPELLLLLPAWYVVFLLSLTCHEAAHAAAAWRGGDPTAYQGGQATLNPLPHILRSPAGTVVVPLLSYLWGGWMMGWASAPYDPGWEDRHPRRAAWMAAAGPAANLVLAALGLAVLRAGLVYGLWNPFEAWTMDHLVQPPTGGPSGAEGLARVASILFSLNFILFVFNLLPVPPLDGAAIVAGLWPRARPARDLLRASPGGGLLGLVIAWQLSGWILPPAYRSIVGWLFR
jgi:Zn-dependent protease